jgi:hypothetical protein
LLLSLFLFLSRSYPLRGLLREKSRELVVIPFHSFLSVYLAYLAQQLLPKILTDIGINMFPARSDPRMVLLGKEWKKASILVQVELQVVL